MSRPRAAAVLLVHGSMHGAWCWDAVTDRLDDIGITHRALDLPGHGTEWRQAPSASMDRYTTAVVEALDRLEGPVVLVGHSMAGQVVARAAFRRPTTVTSLVLLNAQVLRNGQTALETLPKSRQQRYQQLTRQQGGVTYRLPDDEVYRLWLQDLPRQHRRVTTALASVTPQPLRPLMEPAVEQDFGSKGVPAVYVRSTDDVGSPPSRVDGFIALLPPGTSVQDVPGGHDCMVSQPDVIADLLAGIAQEAGRKREPDFCPLRHVGTSKRMTLR